MSSTYDFNLKEGPKMKMKFFEETTKLKNFFRGTNIKS